MALSNLKQSIKSSSRDKRIVFIVSSWTVITSTFSIILIVANYRTWTVNSSWYEPPLDPSMPILHPEIQLVGKFLESVDILISKRIIAEFLIQLVAHILSLFQILTIIILTRDNILADVVGGAVATPRDLNSSVEARLPTTRLNTRTRLLVPVIVFSYLGIFYSALWKGSITPTSKTVVMPSSIEVPSYSNTTHIKEYSIKSSQPGPSARTKNGPFSYSVGTKLLNGLIESGSSATTPDGTTRTHPKIDNTRFFYKGRSYGVSASVGIYDDFIRGQFSIKTYQFQEAGYISRVECHYNKSMDFRIENEFPHRTFAVTGFLPDTVGSAEWSEYIGQTSSSIVAIGVASSPKSPRRYISIAAGDRYRALNATQCTIDFLPTMFQVSVGIKDSSIEVVPLMSIEDFDAQRTLTRTAVRQLSLISNSLMSFHESLLGDAFFSSIAAWNSSFNEMGHVQETSATLLGLQNSLTAMIDSILAGYGAAQLVVGNISKPAKAEIMFEVSTIGNRACIAAVAVLNALTIVLYCFRVLRGGISTKETNTPVSTEVCEGSW